MSKAEDKYEELRKRLNHLNNEIKRLTDDNPDLVLRADQNFNLDDRLCEVRISVTEGYRVIK